MRLIAMAMATVGLVAGAMSQPLPEGASLGPPSPIDLSEPPVVYPPGMYLATSNLNPGAVLLVSGTTETVVYRRPSGLLTAFSIMYSTPHRNLRDLMFVNGFNGYWIWGATGVNTERAIWESPEYVRDIVYDTGHSGYAVLLSHAFGAGRDGEIRFPGGGRVAYAVRLAAVGGVWGGNFALASRNRLFISTGASTGAKIWYCPDYELTGGSGTPSVFYSTTGPILGFCFADDNVFYYTDGSSTVRKVTINKQKVGPLGAIGGALVPKQATSGMTTEVAFVSPNKYRYTDVVVVK
jgi:hypothetical protein